MKSSILLLTIVFVILFSNCEKETTYNHLDWKYTEYKFLILDSNIVEYNTRAQFIRVNDSILLFYGYNKSYQKDCFYKLMLNNDDLKIKNLKPVLDGNPTDIKDVSFANSSTGFLLMRDTKDNTGLSSKMLKTLDGGESWNILNFQNTFSYIHFITPDSGIAISTNSFGWNSAIYSSTDGGNNWQKIINDFDDNHTIQNFYFIPNKPRICFATSGRLLYSTNGGFTWQLHNDIKADITAMSFLNENEGFIFNYSVLAGSPCNNTNTIYKIDQIGGPYRKMYEAGDMISKIEALNENEVYFSQSLSSIVFCTYDGFKTVKRTTIQDPVLNVGGDRIVTDFTIYSRLGVLADLKGTLYLKNK